MTARLEEGKQAAARTETRRAERLALLERFVSVGAEAERHAFERPDTWTEGDAWHTRTQETMNRFWVADRMIRLLFPPPVHEAARAYFLLLNGAVWEGTPSRDDLREALEQPRLTFLDAARAELDG
ncbi:hypothetical protein M1L60_12290 [Actinoplanes sp. TRM 88003]|uniref:Uncharacterized protein n=1 Tax=Paractinoplanes aksuensis TaxID=2939490 RepID=A0ABT1DKL3_9ACTN|nr:hypothetical protein [Actinoplanes aksuensis]MCO8271374.1 hypothetical protein [Actinoplanes aksuensis]